MESNTNFERSPLTLDERENAISEPELSSITSTDPAREALRQAVESNLPATLVPERETSVLKSFAYAGTDERVKAFAQGLFPERLKSSELEGWQTMSGLNFATTLASGFVDFMNLNCFDGHEIEAFQESAEALEEVKRNIVEIQIPFNGGRGERLTILRDLIEFFKRELPQDLSEIPEKLEISDELKNAAVTENFAKDVLNSILNLREVRRIRSDMPPPNLGSLCDEFLAQSNTVENFVSSLGAAKLQQQVLAKLESEGSCMYLPSGWIGNDGGHCAYIILERKNGNIYAHEINSGAGLNPGRAGRHKEEGGIYSERSIPGRTVIFSKNEGGEVLLKKNLLEFIANNFALQVSDGKTSSSKQAYSYRAMYDINKKPGMAIILDPTGEGTVTGMDVGRPRFTECFQRSGNCVMKSTDILSRTVLQRAMAKKMNLGTNDPQVIKRTNQLYRLYGIYCREQILRDYLAWCKDPKNEEVIDRDSLSLLRDGVGRFGYYINRYKGIVASEQRGHLLQRANNLEREISEYLESDAAIKIMRQTNSPMPALSTIPADLAEKAKTMAQNYSRMPQIARQPPLQEEHIALKKEQIEPGIVLQQAKLIIKQIKTLKADTQPFACRKHELIQQATALLRIIPLPDEQSWEEYKNLEESDRCELMEHIHSIVLFLSDLNLAVGSLDQILPVGQNTYSKSDNPAVVNAITRARIIAFELVKMDPFLRRGLSPELVVDHSWFESFCTSAANFHVSKEERDEQMHLFQYIKNQYQHIKNQFAPKLFNYSKPPTPKPKYDLDPSSDSTITYYDEVIWETLGNAACKALINKILVSKTEPHPPQQVTPSRSMEPKMVLDDSMCAILCNHPGLFFYGNVVAVSGGREEILKAMAKQNPGMGKSLSLLRNFCNIMSYGDNLVLSSQGGESKLCDAYVRKINVRDSLEGFGSGYALESENRAHILRIESPKTDGQGIIGRITSEQLRENQPEVMRLIGEELSRPGVQNFGLLRLLEEHLELCDGFYFGNDKKLEKEGSIFHRPIASSEERKRIAELEEKSLLFNLWLQSLNRMLYPGLLKSSEKQGKQEPVADSEKYTLNDPESPLQMDALNHPKELLEAVSGVWEMGKDEFWGNVPDNRPLVKQLCALVHVVHAVSSGVIANNDAGEILDDVKARLESMLGDLDLVRSDCGDSLTGSEAMFLRLARNECITGLLAIAQKNEEVAADSLLSEMYENTFWLQSFDCGRLPKGCSAVIYGFVPSLTPYWEQHPEQAQRIAAATYDRLAFSPGKIDGSNLRAVAGQIGQFEAPGGHRVDLISFHIYDSGNRLTNAGKIFSNDDYKRLFGDKVQEITSTGISHRFVDSGEYGDIIVCECEEQDDEDDRAYGYRDGDLKIYRKFEESDDRWCYVPSSEISIVLLPECFGGDDFTVWVSGNGGFKICAKERPNEVLYESDEQGRLCDVIRREQGTVPYYISFDIPIQNNDIFSRFEGRTYSLFYHDGSGEIQEVMLPRYHDAAGETLRFRRHGENWVLSSNPSYQLIDAPSWPIGGKETKQNLLLGYEGALCLKNTDPKNGGMFKYLLPQHDIFRLRGMTHQVIPLFLKADFESKFFNGARYAEVNLHANDLDFISPSLQETDRLSCLRLARIFQIQGEYGLALQYLDKISSHGQFDASEINALNSIIQGFQIGKEESSLSALVSLKALSCLLRSSPFGENVEKTLDLILSRSSDSFELSPLSRLIGQYLSGFDLQSKEWQLDVHEELALWGGVLACIDTLHEKGQIKFLEKSLASSIVSRVSDLAKLKSPNSASLIKFIDAKINELVETIRNERGSLVESVQGKMGSMKEIAAQIANEPLGNSYSFSLLNSGIDELHKQISVENSKFKDIEMVIGRIQSSIKDLEKKDNPRASQLDDTAKTQSERPLDQLKSQFSELKQIISKHLNDLRFLEQLKRLRVLKRENMPLREAAQIEMGAGDAFDFLTKSPESALHEALFAVEPSIFEGNAWGSGETIPAGEVPQLNLTLAEEDKKQFGSRAVAFLEEFNGELAVGARQLWEISADPVASAVPEVGEISELLAIANAQRSRAIKSAKSAASQIAEIGNRGRLETTHGADAWEPVKIPHALRAYGIFVSGGADGSKRALEYLQRAHPWFSAGELHDFLLHTEAYLVNVNSARHLERVSAALAPLEKSDASADSRAASWCDALPLLRQTHDDAVRNVGDSGLMGNILLFEYATGTRPRPDQVAKITFVMDALVRGSGQHGALIQQIMGSGKTKVLLPLLITLLLNGKDNFPMVVSHVSQLPAVMLELPAILGRVGVHLDLIDADYAQFSNPKMIRAIRQQLETAFAKRNSVPVIASHTLLALRTAFRALSEQAGSKESATTNELYVEFNELFNFMEKKGIALMDEVHVTLNPKESFIIQPPAVVKLDARIAEEDVTFMVDIIHSLPEDLIEPIESNKQDQISPANLKDRLKTHAAGTCGEQFGVPRDLRDAFAGFICGDFDGQEEAALPENVRQWFDNLAPTIKHQVCLLRKLCSSTLPQCLTKVYGEHYGFNDRGEVVPYRNRMPTNNHYKDPHEALCYYILATVTKGIPSVTLGQWVGNLANQGREQVCSGMPFAQTNQAILFERLFDGMDPHLSLLDAVDMQASLEHPQMREGVLQSLQSFLGANPSKKQILATELAQDQASYFPRSYETTPLDIPAAFHGTVSMSGTLSNRESYAKMVSSAVDLQRGALGKIACKLIQDSAAPNAAQPPKTQIVALPEATLDTVESTLAHWKETVDDSKVKNLRIIVDYGAQFKDQPARQSVKNIADFIADSGNGAKYIEYFDPQLNGFAIVSVEDVRRDGLDFKAKKITNPVSDRPAKSEELFTFLDTPRTTGTDPLMMLNGHGLTTLNVLQNDLDGFLQAVMRERKFLHASGQTMDIVLSEKAVQDVFSDGNVPAMPALLSRLVRNTAASINRQQIQAATLQLRELPRRFIENKLRKCAASRNLENLAKWRAATAELIASIDDFEVDAWGDARSWQDVRTILENQWAHTLGRLRDALSFLGDIAGEALAEIPALSSEGEAYIDAIREDTKVLAFSQQETVDVSDQEIQVEAQQQQQQLQEHEQELQLEMQLLHQIFHGDANRQTCVETALARPAAPTPAWNVIGDWQGESVAARLSTDHHRIGALPEKLRERYDDARSVSNSLSEEFSATQNFWETATTPESIFSPYQKNAKYLLLSWDDSTPPQNRCHFLSEYEAASVQKMIDDGSLTECHLCTAAGSSLSQRGALKEGSEAFKEQALWIAHFFNGDTHWLDTHPATTTEMFNRLGMPQVYRADGNGKRNKFLEDIRHFLMLRSSDPKRTDAACKASLLLSTGQQKDPLASFLAEHALTERISPHTIFSAIVDSFNDFNAAHNLPHWTAILLSALDKFGPHALINNQNFGTLFSRISDPQISSLIGAAIDRARK